MTFLKLLQKSLQKLLQNKKILNYIFIFFVIFLFSYDSTFAETTNELKEKVSTLAEALLKWISVLLALITYLATIFLSPEWINGSLFWLNAHFKEIWILVSNLVYFIFAFILIWIAFMNIIWKTNEQYQLKQALPKFIVWVLIVPFSWFLIQFILSISAVLTIASLTLPFSTFDTYSSSLSKVMVPKVCTLNLKSVFGENKTANETTASKDEWYVSCSKTDLVPLMEITWKWDSISSIFWIIAMYTYGVLSFDTIDDVDAYDMKSVKNMWDLIVKILFDLVFVFVYAILMIALWLVLMIRWIYIWIYMMISPVFWLMYFFGKKDWGEGSFFSKFTPQEFIALAMVPVYTMLALSFWLLFLYVVWTWLAQSWTNSWGANSVSIAQDGLKVWDFTLKIEWAVSRTDNITKFASWVWSDVLWIVWGLILKVFGIVVLWWTVMAALGSSKITKTIIAPLEAFGTQIWQIMTSAPWNLPLFWGQSMSSLNTTASSISSSITSKQNMAWTKFAEKFIWWTEKDKEYRNLWTNTPATWQQALANIQELNKIWKSDEIAKSNDAIKAYIKNLDKMLADWLLKDNDEVKKAIEWIKNANWNAQAIRDNFEILDRNATDPNKSILWWNSIINRWDVDKNLWGNVSSNSDSWNTNNNTNNTVNLTLNNKGADWQDVIINKTLLAPELKDKINSKETEIKKLNLWILTKIDFIKALKDEIWLNQIEAEKIANSIAPDKFVQTT